MKKNFLSVLLCLLLIIGGCANADWKAKLIGNKEVNITLKEAIEIGKRFLEKERFDVENLYAITDPENIAWKEYVKNNPTILQSEVVKGMNLEQKKYWAIHYVQKKLVPGINKGDGSI